MPAAAGLPGARCLCEDLRILRSRQLLFGTLALVAGLSIAACSTASNRRRELTPLSAPAWRVELPVKDFAPAVVALPLGATSPRPIVVVIHGARDRAEWQCGSFRGLFGAGVFVVCPQGIAVSAEGGLYGLGSFDENAAELRAVLAALKARYGRYVAPSPIVLVGYAEGAAMAADLARQEPKFFARVALVNGDPQTLSSSTAKIFAERGGQRLLLFCTNPECEKSGGERALWFTRQGALAKVTSAAVGPYFDAAFADALKKEIPWLIDGDARFVRSRR